MDFFVLLGLVVIRLARFYLATQVLDVTAKTVDTVLGDENGEGFGVLTLFVVLVFADRPLALFR